MPDADRSPGAVPGPRPSGERPDRRAYFRIERERRFRLDRLPPELADAPFRRLRDRFVPGTTLRVRRVEDEAGRELITKVGQKLPDPGAPEDPTRRRLTTIYLEPGWAAALGGLDGPTTTKRRYVVERPEGTWAVDAWEVPSGVHGLVTAEIEKPSDAELTAIPGCPWPGFETTEDPRYGAFALATSSPP